MHNLDSNGHGKRSAKLYNNGHTTKFFMGSRWIPSSIANRVISFSFCLFLWVLSYHWQGSRKLHIIQCLHFTLLYFYSSCITFSFTSFCSLKMILLFLYYHFSVWASIFDTTQVLNFKVCYKKFLVSSMNLCLNKNWWIVCIKSNDKLIPSNSLQNLQFQTFLLQNSYNFLLQFLIPCPGASLSPYKDVFILRTSFLKCSSIRHLCWSIYLLFQITSKNIVFKSICCVSKL